MPKAHLRRPKIISAHMMENFPERGNHQDRRESLLECITSWFSETFTTLLQIPPFVLSLYPFNILFVQNHGIE